MALPKQIQAQADALEAYEKQVEEARSAEQPKQDEPTNSEQASPPTVENAPQPVDSTPKPVDDPNSETYAQRWRSLQGQFNSTVPALQQQIAQLTDTVKSLTEQLEQKKESTPEPTQPTELVTKTDIDAFGEDLVDLARRIAKEEFGRKESKYIKQIEALEGKLTEAEGQVGEVAKSQAASQSEKFFMNLSNAIPTWEQVQATPECQEWLMTRIPGVGLTWNEALVSAANRHDLPAVVEVFDAFFAKNPNLNPKAPAQTQSSARAELERQVAPSKSSAATGQQSTAKRTFTARDYELQSMQIMRLNQQGRREEAGRLEAELNAAQNEGRIIP